MWHSVPFSLLTPEDRPTRTSWQGTHTTSIDAALQGGCDKEAVMGGADRVTVNHVIVGTKGGMCVNMIGCCQ
jgi:hypothetical protein